MTNEQIIYNKQLELLKSGIIGTTGREHGYQVKKGQKAIATFNIWRCAKKKKKEEDSEEKKEYMFLTKAFLFSQKQVEKIKSGGDQ